MSMNTEASLMSEQRRYMNGVQGANTITNSHIFEHFGSGNATEAN